MKAAQGSPAKEQVMRNQAEGMEEAQAENRARSVFTQVLAWARGETDSWEHDGINTNVGRFDPRGLVQAIIYPEPHYAICVTDIAVGLYYSPRHVRIMKIFSDPKVVVICEEAIE